MDALVKAQSPAETGLGHAQFWALGLKTGTVVTINHQGQQMQYGNIVAPVALIDAVRAARHHRPE